MEIALRGLFAKKVRERLVAVLLFSLILLSLSQSVSAQTQLINGQSWNGKMGMRDERMFYFDVLRTHSHFDIEFEVLKSQGSGNSSPLPERQFRPIREQAELYIRFGQLPTTRDYDAHLSSGIKLGQSQTSLAYGTQPDIKTGRYYLMVFARTDLEIRLKVSTRSLPSTRTGMGAKPYEDQSGTTFRVWAPNADSVRVAGQFNSWNSLNIPLQSEGNGHWSFDVRGALVNQHYQYVVRRGADTLWKVDPREEQIENSVGDSIIFDDDHTWTDSGFSMPAWNELVVYETHIGTLNDTPGGGPGYFDSAVGKLDYLEDLGVNAVQVLPTSEFPGDFSWGYNASHPFAVESAYGGPHGLKRFVNAAHERGIAVLVDLVFNHFGPNDLSLWRFDGWSQGNFGGIYFYQDNRSNTPWGDTRPDYGRGEVRQFIRDNVLMWFQDFHIDGLRWDSTLYTRTYDHGDLPEGWSLMQWVNDEINATQPWKISIAEDMQGNEWITKTTGVGGTGFDSQWSAQFVHPIRNVIVSSDDNGRDMFTVKNSLEERFNGDAFGRVIYTESHDEVANGRSRVPEEIWPGNAGSWYSRKRSTLGGALVLTTPGIPMLFQGQEILEDGYFQDTDPVDWTKLNTYPGIHTLYQDLIKLRRNWFDTTRGLKGQNLSVFHVNNSDKVVAFHRWDQGGPRDDVIVVCNFRNANRPSNYRIGLPRVGVWTVRLNSDWIGYSPDYTDLWVPDVTAESTPWNGLPYSGTLPIPAYSVVILSQD